MLIDPAVGLALIAFATVSVAGILVSLRRSRQVQDTLDDRWRMDLWTGALRAAGAA